MGSSPDYSAKPSAEFLAVFRAQADPSGAMTFERFMAIALYDPTVGYYRQPRPRVGRGRETDFFTASTSGGLFGELVSNAVAKVLRAGGREPREHTFVEIGAEPEGGVLAGLAHPFGGNRTLRLGDPIALTGRCVVFSNELFDAQPFRRLVFQAGQWRELGVRIDGDGLTEVEFATDNTAGLKPAAEGYHLDLPIAAADLARRIAAEPWEGLFVAFDYGKTLRSLLEDHPEGTARAYFRHTQSNHLLNRPGHQDLTCHICWDWLSDALTQHGFATPALEFQETYFIRHAGDFIARASEADASRLSERKRGLFQLLHPGHMGQKFQVMHSLR